MKLLWNFVSIIGIAVLFFVGNVVPVHAIETIIPIVSPGDLLPIHIELNDLHDKKSKTITIESRIIDEGNRIVYVTTKDIPLNNYIKTVEYIEIPDALLSGNYTVVNNIVYQGVALPATSQFAFKIIKTVFGIPIFNVVLYLIAIIFISLFLAKQLFRLVPYMQRGIKHFKEILHSE